MRIQNATADMEATVAVESALLAVVVSGSAVVTSKAGSDSGNKETHGTYVQNSLNVLVFHGFNR